MSIFKNSKTKNYIIVCISIITIFELCMLYKLSTEYRGIYQINFFIPLIFLQPFLYNLLFKNKKNYHKLRVIIMVLISFFFPLAIYFNLPSYTYNEGKQIVARNIENRESLTFIEQPRKHDTVPISHNSKRLFIDSRVYYYKIKSNSNNQYFTVNPLTGKLTQLKENYWIQDKK